MPTRSRSSRWVPLPLFSFPLLPAPLGALWIGPRGSSALLPTRQVLSAATSKKSLGGRSRGEIPLEEEEADVALAPRPAAATSSVPLAQDRTMASRVQQAVSGGDQFASPAKGSVLSASTGDGAGRNISPFKAQRAGASATGYAPLIASPHQQYAASVQQQQQQQHTIPTTVPASPAKATPDLMTIASSDIDELVRVSVSPAIPSSPPSPHSRDLETTLLPRQGGSSPVHQPQVTFAPDAKDRREPSTGVSGSAVSRGKMSAVLHQVVGPIEAPPPRAELPRDDPPRAAPMATSSPNKYIDPYSGYGTAPAASPLGA